MTVYIEVTYIMNAFLVFLSFEILCFLLNIQITKKELCLYVLTYNISIVLLYIDLFEGFIFFYDLILTFFYFRKQVYIYYPLYMFIYISLLSFLSFLIPQSIVFQGVLLIEGVNITSLSIMGILLLIMIYFYISFCQYKINQNEMVDVSFLDIHCQGFIDNGNRVFYKGYPVIFISQHLLNEYHPIDTIDICTAHSVETVDIIMIDDMMINHQSLHHVYAGLISNYEYDCILNAQLMGGLL